MDMAFFLSSLLYPIDVSVSFIVGTRLLACCDLAVKSEIRVHDASSFALLTKDCSDHSESSVVTTFRIGCSISVKYVFGILIGFALNL